MRRSISRPSRLSPNRAHFDAEHHLSTPSTPVTPGTSRQRRLEPTTPDTPAETFTSGVYRVTVVPSCLSARARKHLRHAGGRAENGAEIVVDSISNGWAHIMDNFGQRPLLQCGLPDARDYVSGDDNDPIQPPRTSHIDGVKTVTIDPGHGGAMSARTTAVRLMRSTRQPVWRSTAVPEVLVKVIMARDTSLRKAGAEPAWRCYETVCVRRTCSSASTTMRLTPLHRGAEILAQIAGQERRTGPRFWRRRCSTSTKKLGVPIRHRSCSRGSHGDYYTNRAAAALNIPALTSEFYSR